jgi:hypothetical protein
MVDHVVADPNPTLRGSKVTIHPNEKDELKSSIRPLTWGREDGSRHKVGYDQRQQFTDSWLSLGQYKVLWNILIDCLEVTGIHTILLRLLKDIAIRLIAGLKVSFAASPLSYSQRL